MLLAAWVIVGFVSLALCYLYTTLWVRPEKTTERLRRQGIKGPPPSFLYGNIPEMNRIQSEENTRKREAPVADDYAHTVFPYFDRWRKAYGPIFTYSTGNIQLLHVSHPNLVKEIGQCKSLDLGKPSSLQRERGPLLGRGIMTSNGTRWAHQRKAIAPELFMDKVKGMVSLMVESTISLLKSWESKVDSTGEILVDDDLRNFSADIISRACFGSSYSRGKDIFSRLRELQKALSKASILVGIPGLRFLPTKDNREIWRLEREIRSLILNAVDEREKESASSNNDLLQAIIESASDGCVGSDTTDSYIVDNYKNIYFAGHETIATSATWCLVLLASHPEWQTCARAEVMEVCQGQLPNADALRKMKTLTMIIHETLRIYPPVAFVIREAFEDMIFGEVHIPKGITLSIPISTLHHDPEIWGPDVDEFNPKRFARGIGRACTLPHAYIPFGTGARTCVGQNFAMVELKIVLSLILSKFTCSLSPNYRHSPAFRLTVEPEFGVPLIFKRI